MSDLLDEDYLTWLYSHVAPVKQKNPSRTYWSLFKQLYQKEFVWFVPNDDNRVEDGRDLRREFLDIREWPGDASWADLGCSMFELFIGLSERLSFEAGGTPAEWFWVLLDNVELADCSDASGFDSRAVDVVLERIIWRTYLSDGTGGLFPLREADSDQRKVELWYQLSAYVLERL